MMSAYNPAAHLDRAHVAKRHRSRKTTTAPPLRGSTSGIGRFTRYGRLLVGLGFLAYFLVGCRIAGDYGISWDEPAMLDFGKYAVSYIRAFDRRVEFLPPERAARFHPVPFEVLYNAVTAAVGAGEGAAGTAFAIW